MTDQRHIMPHSDDAEKGFLSCLLQDPRMIARYSDKLSEDWFYSASLGVVYRALVAMDASDITPELPALTQWLIDRQQLQNIGGGAVLAELLSFAPSAAQVEYYLGVLQDKLTLRRIARACNETMAAIFNDPTEAKKLLDEAESRILQISRGFQQAEGVGPEHARNILVRVVEQIEDWRKGVNLGYKTGFSALDTKLTAGFYDHGFGILGARPSVGKTTLAMNILWNLAHHQKVPCAMFSLETSSENLLLRQWSAVSGLPYGTIRGGKLNNGDFGKLMHGQTKIQAAPLWLEKAPRMPLSTLRNHVRQLVVDHGVKVVAIDYMQLLEPESLRGKQNDFAAVTEVSRELKGLSLELPIYILALSQLSRNGSDDGPPSMKDLRQSGQIEQDATEIFLMNRDGEPEEDAAEIDINLRIAKQKDGATGDVALRFQRETFTFKSNPRA